MQTTILRRVTRVAAAGQSAALFGALACAAYAGDSARIPVPTPQQLAWHEAEVGLFFHWAPDFYQGGEGDSLSTPRDKINPDRFDAGDEEENP